MPSVRLVKCLEFIVRLCTCLHIGAGECLIYCFQGALLFYLLWLVACLHYLLVVMWCLVLGLLLVKCLALLALAHEKFASLAGWLASWICLVLYRVWDNFWHAEWLEWWMRRGVASRVKRYRAWLGTFWLTCKRNYRLAGIVRSGDSHPQLIVLSTGPLPRLNASEHWLRNERTVPFRSGPIDCWHIK